MAEKYTNPWDAIRDLGKALIAGLEATNTMHDELTSALDTLFIRVNQLEKAYNGLADFCGYVTESATAEHGGEKHAENRSNTRDD